MAGLMARAQNLDHVEFMGKATKKATKRLPNPKNPENCKFQ